MPLVSVVTTVWNPGKFLRETIRSILDQSLTDFELLLVDDGSTDGSRELIEQFAARDSRIRPFPGQHRGAVAAANFGIAQATGKYLARIDHDDVALPDRLRDQVAFLETHPDYVLLGTAYEVIGADGTVLPHARPVCTEDSRLRQLLPRECPFCHSSVMMRLATLRACGGYREAFDTAEDYDLWVRLSHLGRIANLPQVGVRWRRHGGQTSVRKLEQQMIADTAVKLVAKRLAGNQPDPFASVTELLKRSDLNREGITDADINRSILDGYELWAREFMRDGNTAESAAILRRAAGFARAAPGLTPDQAARYHFLLAAFYLRQRRFLAAIGVIKSTLLLAPGYPWRWLKRRRL